MNTQRWEQPGSGFRWSTDSGAQSGLPAVNFDAPRPEHPGIPKNSRTMRDPSAGSAAGSFVRAAIPAALDAAALPVTLGGKLAERLGYPNQAAHLSGQDALEAGEWLYRGVDPAQQRRELSEERANYPASGNFGEDLGAAAGGYYSGELAGRGIGLGARAAVGAGKYVAREIAAAGGLKSAAKQVALSPVHMMTGLGPSGGTSSKVASTVERGIEGGSSRARDYVPSPRAQEQHAAATAFIKSHPGSKALRHYMQSGYDEVNAALRPGGESKTTTRVIDTVQKVDALLADAHKQGLVHEGPTVRGLSLPAGTVDKWKAAGAVKNKSYWSTSHDPSVAEDFIAMTPPPGPNEKVLLQLDQKSGVPVGGYEREILMPRNRNWLIRKHELRDDGTNVLHLEEVPALPPGVKPELSYNERELGDAIGRAV